MSSRPGSSRSTGQASSLASKASAAHLENEKGKGSDRSDLAVGEAEPMPEELQRRMKPRQVQFFAIGGSIGTALFISIGFGLLRGGAASLLLAFVLHAAIMSMVNTSLAEMTVFMPVSSAFIQHASRWVDKAWGFMLGWNFFLFEALLIPFEINTLVMILGYWWDNVPAGVVIALAIAFYAITNVLAVAYFGEAEFWLSCGKLILIVMLYLFTLVTMAGANPQGNAYGFTNWSKPGPFMEYLSTGSLGRFEGFLAALWQSAFIIVGPEYLGACAGEVQQPRKTLTAAFKQVYWRFVLFFVLGALCVGIVLPANDATLNSVLGRGETSSGASSPFVIAMKNLGVGVLPHIANALLFTTVYSAGNCYVYTASRSLHSLVVNGHAPQFLRKTTRNGVPIYCLGVAMAFACLAFLRMGSSSQQVLIWLTNLITGGTLVTYIGVCVNYVFFYRALKAQNYDRDSLPWKGFGQPYVAWIALVWMVGIELFYGYSVFRTGQWDVGSFFSSYAMLLLAIATFTSWKICKRTKAVDPREADLVWARPAIDYHEATFEEAEPWRIWQWVRGLSPLKRFGKAFQSDV